MIKIIEQGQKTFIRTCDRCGCKFQYDLSDLSGLEYISCPCCHNTLVHIGPKTTKIDLDKTNKVDWIDTGKINIDDIRKHTTTTPYKVEVGDAGYNYVTTTGQYVNPATVTTIGDINKPGSDCVTGKVDPSITIYANKLPDDIKDNCCYESDDYKAWYKEWCKKIREREPIKCKK